MKQSFVNEVMNPNKVRDSLKDLKTEIGIERDRRGWATEDGQLLNEWVVELRRLISFFV